MQVSKNEKRQNSAGERKVEKLRIVPEVLIRTYQKVKEPDLMWR
jgi:hypothetical protein